MLRSGSALVIAVVAVVLIAVAVIIGYLSFTKAPVLQAPIPDTSAWKIYNNDFYGFQMKYPENWQLAIAGSQTGSDYITGFELGNPLAGQLIMASSGNPNLPFLAIAPAYVLRGSVEHDLSATSTAKSVAVASATLFGTKFEKEHDVRIGTFKGANDAKVGAYDAYEFYGVDHGTNPKTEEIFVAHNGVDMAIEFPVAETPADKYNASPAENNVIAREIINTLIFTK